jgi:hypothetical protein
MQLRRRLSTSRGLTVVELSIVLVLLGAIALGCVEFYRAKLKLREARATLAASRGHLGVIIDELGRQLARTKPLPADSFPLATSTGFDTLEIFVPATGNGVDTVRYFVNRFDDPPSLIKQTNQETPTVFAQGIDTARFVPVGGPPPEQLSVVLVSVDSSPSDPGNRFRLGETVPLRTP